jgi:hypothetical protein
MLDSAIVHEGREEMEAVMSPYLIWHTWSEIYGNSLTNLSLKKQDLLIKKTALNRMMYLIYEFI